MSKPFDLEAAKAGAEVQYGAENGIRDVHFIGVNSYRRPVIEFIHENYILVADPQNLRMKPVKKTMWVQCYTSINGGSVYCTNPQDTPEVAIKAACNNKLIGKPQTITVEV